MQEALEAIVWLSFFGGFLILLWPIGEFIEWIIRRYRDGS